MGEDKHWPHTACHYQPPTARVHARVANVMTSCIRLRIDAPGDEV